MFALGSMPSAPALAVAAVLTVALVFGGVVLPAVWSRRPRPPRGRRQGALGAAQGLPEAAQALAQISATARVSTIPACTTSAPPPIGTGKERSAQAPPGAWAAFLPWTTPTALQTTLPAQHLLRSKSRLAPHREL